MLVFDLEICDLVATGTGTGTGAALLADDTIKTVKQADLGVA